MSTHSLKTSSRNFWGGLLENQVVAIVLGLLLVVPALFAGSPERRSGQFTAYAFLGLVLLVVWLLRAQDRVTWPKVRALLTRGPNLPILLFLGWGILSLALSFRPIHSQLALVQLGFGVLIYAMVVYEFRQRMQIRTLISALMLVGVLLVVGALTLDAQRQFLDLAGSFHDRQLFGAFLGLVLPVLIGVAAGTKNRAHKTMAQVSAVLTAAALLLTRCRSAWLGVLVALLVFLVLSVVFVWKTWGTVKRSKHELIITPALGIAALGIFLWFTGMVQHVQWRAATFGMLQSDVSVVDRMNMWQVAVDTIAAKPLLGWGIGTYPIAQIAFNSLSRGEVAILTTGPSLSESPHNTYLQIAGEQGWIGLALYLAILACFFHYGLRALGPMDRGLRKYTLIGCLAAMAGQCVDAIANPGWTFPEVSMFFWLVLGLGMNAAGLGQEVVEEERPADPAAPVLGVPRPLYRGARTALIGFATIALVAHFLNLNLMSAALAGGKGDGKGDGKGGGGGAAQIPGYGGGGVGGGGGKKPGGGEEDEGLSSAAIAGIAAGSVLVGAAAAHFFFGTCGPEGGAFAAGEAHECKERYPDLPEGLRELRAIRLAPEQSTIRAGYCRCFHLEVQSATDNHWYSVTHREATTFRLTEPSPYLVQHEGTKNIFCVPSDVPADANGKIVTLEGIYQPSGGSPMNALAQVRTRVPKP